MNYALGYAFTIKDILYNFPLDKLQFNCKDSFNIIHDNHRIKLVSNIFRDSIYIILQDIINNNVTFWLPLTGAKKCNIHIRRVQGDEFKNLRKSGKWKDIDILKSMFSGYQLSLYMLGNRTPRIKPIYLNKELTQIITDNTNLGITYGDSKNDKTINDYIDIISSKYPSIGKSDIRRILIFSWKSLYLHNSYGGDTIIVDKRFWFYIGYLKKRSLDHFYYYIKKLTIKLRVLYKRKNIQWDGYYYFALSESQYQKYLQQKNKRGRPKKYFNFGSVYLYQIYDECKINEFYKKYIFKVPFITQLKTKQFVRDFNSGNAELILTRDPLKFKDILVYENEYNFL